MVFEQSAELRSVCWLFRLNRINLPVNLNSVCLTMQILKREREREREWNVYNRRQKQTCKHLLSAITFKDCLFAHDNMTSRERREERESQRGIISIDMFLAIDIIRRKLDISLSTI